MTIDTRQPSRRIQFSLGAMLAAIAVLAVSVYFLNDGLVRLSNAMPILYGTSAIASLIGVALASLLRIERPARRTLMVVGCGLAVGAANSFFVIQMEWHRQHPWPESDIGYLVLAVVRSGLLGVVIAYVVSVAFKIATPHATDRETVEATPTGPKGGGARPVVALKSAVPHLIHSHLQVKKLLIGGVVIAALVLCWWPYWSFHRVETASIRLLVAIEAGRADLIPERVASVKKFNNHESVIGGIAFRALHGRDERVRMAALKAMKLLGESADDAPVLEPMLKEMLRDESKAVREAAAEWLEAIDPNGAADGGLQPTAI